MASVRDALTAAFDEHQPEGVVAEETPAGTQPEKVVESTIPDKAAEAAPAPAEPAKPSRTAGRPRDDKGRLLPGKPAPVTAPAAGAAAAPIAEAPPVVAKPHPMRPQSWKKEMWDHWGKLDPQVAEYVLQREQEFQRGVSAYKNEWDNVRPIAEAMAQFQPILQQHGIRPEQWITNLGNAHKTLAMGTPEQKLSAFAKLVDDYKIPVESLFVQGQDGRLYRNPNIQQHQPQHPQEQQPDVRQLVQQTLLEERTAADIKSFQAAANSDGSPKYPHFETVRPTMIGLLQAELATDLEDAYKQALNHPRHSDIATSIRQAEEKAATERKAAEAAARVAAARKNAVSVKGSAPQAPTGDRPKGVRANIEAAWDEVVGSGRV